MEILQFDELFSIYDQFILNREEWYAGFTMVNEYNRKLEIWEKKYSLFIRQILNIFWKFVV